MDSELGEDGLLKPPDITVAVTHSDSEETVTETSNNAARTTPGGISIANASDSEDSAGCFDDDEIESVKSAKLQMSDDEDAGMPSPLPVEMEPPADKHHPVISDGHASKKCNGEDELKMDVDGDNRNNAALNAHEDLKMDGNGDDLADPGTDGEIDDDEPTQSVAELFRTVQVNSNPMDEDEDEDEDENENDEDDPPDVQMEDVFGGIEAPRPAERQSASPNPPEPSDQMFSMMISAFQTQIMNTLCLEVPAEEKKQVEFADVPPIVIKLKWNDTVKKVMSIPSSYIPQPKRLFDEELLAPKQTGDDHERQQLRRLLATRQAESRHIRDELDRLQRKIQSKSREVAAMTQLQNELKLKTKESIHSYRAKKRKLQRIEECIQRRVEYHSDASDDEYYDDDDEPTQRRRAAPTSRRTKRSSGSSRVSRKRRLSHLGPERVSKRRRVSARCDGCEGSFKGERFGYGCEHELCRECVESLRPPARSALFRCPKCSKKFPEEDIRMIDDPNLDRSTYSCRKCSEQFDDVPSLEQHMVDRHGENGQPQPMDYDDAYNEPPPQMFRCNVDGCAQECNSERALSDHIGAFHPNFHESIRGDEDGGLPPRVPDLQKEGPPPLSQGLSQQEPLPPLPHGYPFPSESGNIPGLGGMLTDEADPPRPIETGSGDRAMDMLDKMEDEYAAVHGDHN